MNSVNNEEKFKKMSSKRLPKHYIICVYANSIIKQPSEDGNYFYNIYIIGNYVYTLMCSQQTWVNNYK